MVEFNLHPETPAQVDIEEREAAFVGFVRFCGWAILHILIVVGYLTLVLGIGFNWLASLAIMFAAGLAGGWLMRLSSAWTIILIAHAALVIVARLCILLLEWMH